MTIKIEGRMKDLNLTQDILQVTPCKIRMEEAAYGNYEYTGMLEFSIEGNEDRGKVIIYPKLVNPEDNNETNMKEAMTRQARELLRQMADAKWKNDA